MNILENLNTPEKYVTRSGKKVLGLHHLRHLSSEYKLYVEVDINGQVNCITCTIDGKFMEEEGRPSGLDIIEKPKYEYNFRVSRTVTQYSEHDIPVEAYSEDEARALVEEIAECEYDSADYEWGVDYIEVADTDLSSTNDPEKG